MNTSSTFDNLLDAVEHLPPDEQAQLIAVIQRRLSERERKRIVEEVQQGRRDFENGLTTEVDVDELMREIEL